MTLEVKCEGGQAGSDRKIEETARAAFPGERTSP